jgi:predicted AlkP superfamily phosphohydrolase/phosphomutase
MDKPNFITSALFFISSCIAVDAIAQSVTASDPHTSTKLSWFIPDGFRADPDLFDIFRWANEGKLPNIKRMMDAGSYGYSIPVFPSHTPANFAALLTGMYPKTNGVPDGPMRIEGQPLEKSAIGGFSSSARRVPAVWSEVGPNKSVVLLSMPGSTPPELKSNAVTIRGRWGGWGADTHSIIFERDSLAQRTKLAKNSRLFMQGMELTRFVKLDPSYMWTNRKIVKGEHFAKLDVYGVDIYMRLHKKSLSGNRHASLISFSRDKSTIDATLGASQWSKWIPTTVNWNGRKVLTNMRLNVIDIGPDGFFRVRVLIDNLNSMIVEPPEAAAQLEADIGPMVDFPDNFPPQLVFYPSDKNTFLAESRMSLDWHKMAVESLTKRYQPDIFIHDIYTPNQMLTSRWWMGYIDPTSSRYSDVSQGARRRLWEEVMEMYKSIDAIVGKTFDAADKDTLVVFSSDHGVIPLNSSVQINNLFAKKGWIKYQINPTTGEPIIDWERTQVFFLKMSNVYINPRGLGPKYQRGSGPEYEALRDQVIDSLQSLKDEKGVHPLERAVKWEDVESVLKLPPDRTGDIVIANKAGYGWAEDITNDQQVFVVPLETGYKQAVFADDVKGLWAPFIIVGKGVRKDFRISQPIRHIDQLPTIFRAMNIESTRKLEGNVIDEIFVTR